MKPLRVSKTGKFISPSLNMDKTILLSPPELELLRSLLSQVSINPVTEKALDTARTVYELSKKLE